MNRTIAVVFAIALLAAPATASAAGDPHVFDKAAYAAASARARTGEAPPPDYLWLRQQRAARDSFIEGHWDAFKEADSLIDSNPARALDLARARMADNWTELMPHLVARIALRKLGRDDEAAKENDAVRGILESVTAGKHGTSDTDAFNAVTSGEEYPVLMLMGIRMNRQALVPKDGHTFDVMTGTDRDGKSHEIWFNIDFFFGREGGIDKLLKN